MIKLLTSPQCSRCKMVKEQLQNNNIEFKEANLNELENKEKNKYILKAQKKNITSLPILVQEGEVVAMDEVI